MSALDGDTCILILYISVTGDVGAELDDAAMLACSNGSILVGAVGQRKDLRGRIQSVIAV